MLPRQGQSEPGNGGNKGVLSIPQNSSIAGTSPSDCLVSYLGHPLVGGSYPSAEKQSVYSTAPADWAIYFCVCMSRCMHVSAYICVCIYVCQYID